MPEILDGESSALRMVWSWRPVVLDTPEESGQRCQLQHEDIAKANSREE